jgi:nucleotide-binding universal stress UspA family protein
MPPHLALSVEPTVTPSNILFATDFSRQSAFVLEYVLAIARKWGSKVYAVHVMPEPVGLTTSTREGLRAVGVQPKSEIPVELEGLKKTLSTIPHEVLYPRGDIWFELSKIVEANKIDLIVAGTHGRGGVAKFLMGSVAEKIFRRASCPVLTVGPAVSGEPESVVDLHEVLFATDLSAVSMAALPYAISLAQENNARLYILHVMENPVTVGDENVLKERLRSFVPQEAKLTSPPKVIIEFGPPAQRILAVAEGLGVDLIVLGARRTPMYFEASGHLSLATAYSVVSQAICPVLTVGG